MLDKRVPHVSHFRDVGKYAALPPNAKFACFPFREKSCQAPFCTQFPSTPSLQTENKVRKHGGFTPLNLLG
jgi:hypothetical protein